MTQVLLSALMACVRGADTDECISTRDIVLGTLQYLQTGIASHVGDERSKPRPPGDRQSS